MRGQPTLPGLHTFRIGSEGVTVFPPVVAPTALVAAADAERISASRSLRVGTGVPRLDEMLGGGLPSGYSLLVAGPSGSGKSVLAAAFLAEGARRGEAGVIAAFEQRPSRSRDRTLAELIEGGLVGVVDSRAPDLSVDEVMLQLTREIRRRSASRVVIDSLSGFELAIAPTFRHDFRESLARMIAALADAGVTVLMTSELEDRYADLRFSPHGTAFMTDAIIVQRYIEVESRLLRVMAVIKVRASAHSNELRLFSIDDDGICIGESVHDHESLLGRPTIKHPSAANPDLELGASDPPQPASGVGELIPRAHGVSA
jgi:circadian clock protein KaiC